MAAIVPRPEAGTRCIDVLTRSRMLERYQNLTLRALSKSLLQTPVKCGSMLLAFAVRNAKSVEKTCTKRAFSNLRATIKPADVYFARAVTSRVRWPMPRWLQGLQGLRIMYTTRRYDSRKTSVQSEESGRCVAATGAAGCRRACMTLQTLSNTARRAYASWRGCTERARLALLILFFNRRPAPCKPRHSQSITFGISSLPARAVASGVPLPYEAPLAPEAAAAEADVTAARRGPRAPACGPAARSPPPAAAATDTAPLSS
ncbi:hypothetical protein MSG28_004832 [Choristoneura fumiferana]|uniref:Uncharacterized protein n=1 Tax=Choristoneura fumiferana TaxID=7141 RepID=A0ACC0K8G5_CHOFU|nr:hypothetical protein MSG28_004832 [Choristoneura fumiferana]